MKNNKATLLLNSIQLAQQKLTKLTPKQKELLEKAWDIEHAYYSSALEGSKIDKSEFVKIAEKIA